ncbi:MAG: lysylphosphatidylglycerol synthase transmembrane domain-containing protein [Halapricum sp.]
MADRRRVAVMGLQAVLAAGALVYVASQIDLRRAGTALLTLELSIVVAIVGLTAVEFLTRFSMWYALLHGLDGISFETSARVDLVIKFVNHVLPSKASGHSVAPLVVRHYTGVDWTDAVAVGGLNTGLYATLYGVVSLAGIALFATRLQGGLAVVIALSTALYLGVGVLVLLAGRHLNVAGRLIARLEGVAADVPRIGERVASLVTSLPTFTADSAATFRALSSNSRVVSTYVLGWSSTLVLIPGLRMWLLLNALGEGFTPAALVPVVLVMAYSVTVLPITPGGIGISEASATLVFVAFGVAPEVAGIAVLLDRSFGVYLPALIGWVPAARVDLFSRLPDS